jgi:hypothetical protein
MGLTSTFFCDLEKFGRIEASILKTTKVNKVMKAIAKLDPGRIPREEEYRFIHRARALSTLYGEILAEDVEREERRISEALDRVREQAALVRTVKRRSSTDQWIWIDHEDAMSGLERSIARHPSWDSGLAEGPPERGDETKEEYETRLWKWVERNR